MDKGTVYFFTGLAGAGKTTIGRLFYDRIKARRDSAILFDGDTQRAAYGNQDYTYEGRLKGAWGLFAQCKELADQGNDVVVCSISMYHAIQNWNRENIENYREIYVKASMETLYKKKKKKLYSSGVENVVGVDIPAEFPEHPDVVLENDGQFTPEEIVAGLETRFGL